MTILNMVYGGGGSDIKFSLTAISNLALEGGDSKATITRTDPNDKVFEGVTLVAWARTILVRKVGSAPTSTSDGTVVLTNTTRNQYSSTGYVDTGLTNGTTYYYAAFAIGDNGTSVISNTPSVEPAEPLLGIYHKSSLGLISISSDGNTWITMADKNLGATIVWNSGDAPSAAKCGYYYQRGNNYGFPRSGKVTNVTTKPDASNYGPGNYYSSSNFILVSPPSVWSSVQNDNLWGNTTNTLAARQGPCASGYHVPSYADYNNLSSMKSALGISNANMIAYLKLPLTGTRNDSDGYPYYQNYSGRYWSSTPTGGAGYILQINKYNDFYLDSIQGQSYGGCIRPFKNEPVIPDNTRTKLN